MKKLKTFMLLTVLFGMFLGSVPAYAIFEDGKEIVIDLSHPETGEYPIISGTYAKAIKLVGMVEDGTLYIGGGATDLPFYTRYDYEPKRSNVFENESPNHVRVDFGSQDLKIYVRDVEFLIQGKFKEKLQHGWIPLRFVATLAGYDVNYDAITKHVIVTK